MNIITKGLIEFVRSGTEPSPLPYSKYKVSSKYISYLSGVGYPTCNGIIEMENNALTSEEIDQIIAPFKANNLPFVWWADNPLLKDKGFQFGGIMKGIYLDLTVGNYVQELPANVQVKKVTSSEEIKDFTNVIGQSFGFDEKLVKEYGIISEAAMDIDEQIHFVAYEQGIPVATATLTTTPLAAGIWNCATLPEHRRKGLGRAVCLAAINEAIQLEYSEVMAILMPKGMASGIFEKLGFKEISDLPFHVHGLDADQLEK